MTDETSKTADDAAAPVSGPHAEPAAEAAAYVTPEPAAPVVAGAPSHRPLALAVGVLAIVVVVGFYMLWSSRGDVAQQDAALQDKLNQLQTRLQALEARPVPPPVNLTPLDQRLTALETKPPPTVGLDSEARKQIAALAGRLDSVEARENQLGTQEQADATKFAAQIASLDTQAAAAAKASSQMAALAGKEAQTAALQAAAVALQAGKPLGAIPGAPPALAQFADKPPPTEASLRLSFAAAADKALEAGEPPPPDTPFLNRLWDRAQSAVTVRKAGQVLVGNSVSGTLEQARHALDAGDIGGAVKVLGELRGPAAQAMAPWQAQAQALLDARSALAAAAHS